MESRQSGVSTDYNRKYQSNEWRSHYSKSPSLSSVHRGKSTVTNIRHAKSRKLRKFHRDDDLISCDVWRYRQFLSIENAKFLRATVKALMEPDKGIIKFDSGIIETAPLRTSKADYTINTGEDLIKCVCSGLSLVEPYLSGIVMEESLLSKPEISMAMKSSHIKKGIDFHNEMVELPGTHQELASAGMDDFPEQMARAVSAGAEFALWTVAYIVSDSTPSFVALEENGITLARFARTCQQSKVVPVICVELHAVTDINLSEMQKCFSEVLSSIVMALNRSGVLMEGLILRAYALSPTLVPPERKENFIKNIAYSMLKSFNTALPPSIGGILIYGGETLEVVLDIIDKIQKCNLKRPYPISFLLGKTFLSHWLTKWFEEDISSYSLKLSLSTNLKECSKASMGQLSDKKGSIFLRNISTL